MKSSAALQQIAFDEHLAMFRAMAPGTLLVVKDAPANAILVELDVSVNSWQTLRTKNSDGNMSCTYRDFYKDTPLLFVSRVNNTELPYIVVMADEKLWRVYIHYLAILK